MKMLVGAATAALVGFLAASSLPGEESFALEANPAPADPAAAVRAALGAGYLPSGAAPDSLAILPPPPAKGSAAQARDDEAAKAAVAVQGSARWAQATRDAEIRFPAAAETFACALGIEISADGTPALYRLLQHSLVDVGLATYPTKTKYQRVRPFVVNGTKTCTPDQEQFLRRDGSYPSGHSAIGWAWALILAEAAPDHRNELLARGRAFGQSRVICNVHWLSDTEEGRVMAAATVAALHDDPQFLADLNAAKAEITAARAAGSRPLRDCAVETAGLAADH